MSEMVERVARATEAAEERRRLAKAHCPPDILEFGLNHGIPAFAEREERDDRPADTKSPAPP